MALSQIVVPAPQVKKGSGGLFSKIGSGLGAAIGGVAGIPGGAAGVAGGISTGLGVGSQVGGMIDKPDQLSGPGVKAIDTQQSSAVNRKLANDPSMAAATVNESLAAIQRADERTRAVYEPFLIAAKRNLETRIG